MIMLSMTHDISTMVGIACETCSSKLSRIEVQFSHEIFNEMICDSCYSDHIHANDETSFPSPY